MAAPETQKIPPRTIALTVVIMLATIMQTLDMTIANVALPHMQSSMNAAQDQITWVLTSYVVAAAIGMSLTGYMVDRFGRTRVFLYSVIGFTIASMLCGIAQGLPEMVVFRMLQGALGASLVPLSQAILMDIYPREKFGPALAIWGMGVMVGPIFGPTLGGYLTDTLNWRWVFFINLPIGVLCAAGIAAWLPETKRNQSTKFDMRGFAFIAVALTSFQLMLDRGQTLDWFSSTEIVIEGGIAIIAFYLFIVHIFTVDRPFLNPKLFADRNYVAGSFLGFVTGMTLFSTMALLPSMLQSLIGYPIIETGILLMPRGVGSMIAMGFAGKMMGRIEPRLMMLAGVACLAISLWQMSGFDLNVTEQQLIVSGFIQGMGIGLFFAPMNIIAFGTLPQHLRTDGTAIFSLIRSIGSSVGISAVVTMLAQNTQANHEILGEHITLFSRPLQNLAPEAPWNMSLPHGIAALNGEVTRQASMIAYVDVFSLMMWMTIACMPILFLLRPTRKKDGVSSTEHVAEV
jgi:DHA2 family multidrug resistance protein